LPKLERATWIGADARTAVLAGPARDLVPYVNDLSAAANLPRIAAPVGALFDGSTRRSRRKAGWNILLRTGKTTDGWVSRHCTRPLSRPISFLLLSLGFKANDASILTLLIGLATAALALHPGYLALAGTGILFQFTSVLDGVDGEMARATLTESKYGALLDTVVDQVTYLACFIGVTIGWIREGAGRSALLWTVTIVVGIVVSLLRGWRFVSRHAPNTSFVFIDRSVRRAARDSGQAALKVAAAVFTLFRRDAFATVFLFIALAGSRKLIPAVIALGIVLANLTLSTYRRELAAAALAERLSN
jgi:CDP-L-myo-inositol myo-inositolphosphotransferase